MIGNKELLLAGNKSFGAIYGQLLTAPSGRCYYRHGSGRCDYSTALEYSFACDGIFAGNPFRCEVKVDLENPALGYNRFAWK